MCLVGVFVFSVTEAPNEETTSSPPSPGTRLSQEDLKNLAQASRFCWRVSSNCQARHTKFPKQSLCSGAKVLLIDQLECFVVRWPERLCPKNCNPVLSWHWIDCWQFFRLWKQNPVQTLLLGPWSISWVFLRLVIGFSSKVLYWI